MKSEHRLEHSSLAAKFIWCFWRHWTEHREVTVNQIQTNWVKNWKRRLRRRSYHVSIASRQGTIRAENVSWVHFANSLQIHCKCFFSVRYESLNRDRATKDTNQRQFERLTDSQLLPLVSPSSNVDILIGNSSLEKNEYIRSLDLFVISDCSSAFWCTCNEATAIHHAWSRIDAQVKSQY